MNAGDMLLKAAELVGGQRAADYGDKYENHRRIADLWNMWLKETRAGNNVLSECQEIHAYDVAMMMLLLKIARLMHSPGHQDSHIDIAGYASILEEVSNGK